jgi:hypothetical protein
MTYGFRPDNWWRFDQELRARGIVISEIERVEIEPLPIQDSSAIASSARVTVTLRSGRTEAWIHQHSASIR